MADDFDAAIAELLGVDWGDVGKDAFGGVHMAGRTILSLYGAGSIADKAEGFEGGALPSWAKTAPGSKPAVKPGAAPASGTPATMPATSSSNQPSPTAMTQATHPVAQKSKGMPVYGWVGIGVGGLALLTLLLHQMGARK